MAVGHHVFLSPHCDDAALSCGGVIAQLERMGHPVVIATIFGGKPDYAQLSPFAQSIHMRPHAGANPLDLRLAEEREALSILGAHSQLYPYLDCIYRRDPAHERWLYESEDALFGQVDPADDALLDDLTRSLSALVPAPELGRFYAPMAIGSHVDHQLVHEAARRLQTAGYGVKWYEDYPYVIRDPAGLRQALTRCEQLPNWRAEVVAFEEEDMKRKISAVCAYRSQLGVLFGVSGAGSESAVAPALLAFGQQVANAGGVKPYGERLWRLRRSSQGMPARRPVQFA